MERDFYTDEFEDLIKLKADQYRMYPSEKVWKGIKRSLHSNKRKYWFGFALLLTGLSYFGIDQLIVSPPAKQVMKPSPANTPSEKQQAKILPFDQLTPDATLNPRKPALPLNQDNQVNQDNKGLDITNLPDNSLLPEINSALASALVVVAEQGNLAASPDLFREEAISKQLPIVGRDKPQNVVQMPTVLTSPEKPSQKQGVDQEQDIQKINWLQEYAVYDLAPAKP